MAIKKMRAKTHKGTAKRVKVTNGGDLSDGKLVTNRINKGHRNIKKQRERLLKSRRSTTLNKIHNKLKSLL
jgi:ribosomal protein L35